jgi:competence protein ComGC
MKQYNDDDEKLLRTAVKAFIMFAFVVLFAIMSVWIIVFAFAVKTSETIEKDGLKAVVESVWCGKNKQCLK